MPETPHVIRPAVTSDARALAAFARTTFCDTFAAMNTAENMALHCAASYHETIQGREITDPLMDTLVCEHQGRLIGFTQIRRGPHPECVAARHPTELQRLYVAKDWHGRGIAGDLMNRALAVAKERGADLIWLGVWEHNPRALAFYRKFGFVEVGDHVFPLGTDPQRDLVMTRPV